MHIRSIAQSGRALRSGRRGRRFESCYSDQKLNRRYAGFVFGRIDNWIWCIVIASAMAGFGLLNFCCDMRWGGIN